MDGLALNGAPPDAACEPIADRRVADLFRLVDSGDFDLLSLDVFDTVVFREAPRPADVFFHVAQALRARGMLFDSSSDESFVRERIQAAARARGRRPGGEVTLDEIWAEFPRGYLCSGSVADGARLEYECERRVVRVHEPMRALIEHARAQGLKTAFVSDTYFTKRQVRELTGLETDWTIVSCEHGRSKLGGLHAVLLERSRVAPERVLHVGDSREADVLGPERLGIARYWLRGLPEGFEELAGRDLPDALSRRAPLVRAADGGLTALRGHAMAACTTNHQRWGAGVLGPVVAAYADWVARRCEALGVRTVLCLMREGRSIRRALLASGAPLETHEVFVSRFVALQAAIVTGSAAEIARFVLRPTPVVTASILAQLGLEPADVPELDPARTLAHAEAKALVQRVASTPALRRKVLEASALARAGLLAHLKPFLPARGSRLAVADLGYKGTIQMGLQAVFDHERLGLVTHGLYLVTGDGVHETQSSGAAVEGWLAENGQPAAMAHTFLRSPVIFEQSLMADCGTTLGHGPDGTPVLDEFRVPEGQRAEIADVQRGLDAFLAVWTAHRSRHGGADPDTLRELCRAIAVRAVARPFPVELDLFAHWAYDENFGSALARTLTDVADLHDWERSHLSAHQLASLPYARVYWPFGFAWALSPVTGEAVANIFLRTAEPWAFDSAAGARPITFLWDDGAGFRDECSRTASFTTGTTGRCWHRASLAVSRGGPTGIAFGIGIAGQWLEVAGMRVIWRSEDGGCESRTLPADTLLMQGVEAVAGGVQAVTGDTALVLAELPANPGFRGTVECDLFFTVIERA
jgi:FMN phosphatase YigB (HAD superfamily)